MRTIGAVRAVVPFVVSTLSLFAASGAHAADEEPAETTPVEKAPAAEAPPPPAAEPPPAEEPPAAAEEATPLEIPIVEWRGWRVTVEGRANSFLVYGWGNQYMQMDPADGVNIGEGTGLGTNQNQSQTDGNFHTPRLRNGFLGNVLTFKIERKMSPSLKVGAVFSLWSDIETNQTVYLQPQTFMQEGYLKLEGPWGSFAAGRQLALFSRGAVEIDYNYAHAYGVGWPCNFNGILPSCGQIGFGVLFPFFRSGMLYTTPSLGGLTIAGGIYDPVILAGKWERVIMPTVEAEVAYTAKLGRLGMIKIFGTGLWQKLGAAAMLPNDTRAIANKTVDQIGGAGGMRLEIGPVRLGIAGHYGKGLGLDYAQENSEAAFFNAPMASDPRDGDLRTFQGYYVQGALVLGKVTLASGIGASQALRFSFEQTSVGADGDTSNVVHPPKQNLGINAVFWYHIYDNLVFDVDYFRAQYSWWGASFKQTINVVNSGITVMF
jgi:hypothetical protein